MTDEELKVKAENLTVKYLMTFMDLVSKEIDGMTEDETGKFMMYFLAAISKSMTVLENENKNELPLDREQWFEFMDHCEEIVYQ